MKIDDIHEMAHDISNYVNEHYMLKSLNQQLFDENERLNATIDELDDSITWWTNRFNAVQRDYEELKEELGNNYDLFMYEINLCLLQKIDKAIDFIDNWKKYKKDKGSLEVSMLDLLYIKEILGDKESEQ